MTAARTSLWSRPRQNVHAKRPAESLGRWLRHQAARWGCSWRLQPFGCVLSKDFLRVSSRYRSARIPIRGAFSSFSWQIWGEKGQVRWAEISFFFYCAPNCKVPKSSENGVRGSRVPLSSTNRPIPGPRQPSMAHTNPSNILEVLLRVRGGGGSPNGSRRGFATSSGPHATHFPHICLYCLGWRGGGRQRDGLIHSL
jgi:hypothetical protein